MEKIEKSLLLILILAMFATSHVCADNMKMSDSILNRNMVNVMMKSNTTDHLLKQIST